MKYVVTKIDIAHFVAELNGNNSSVIYNDARDGPPHQLLHQYITRYQLTQQDYYPIDVESIRWLTEQSSTLQFLSLDHCEKGPLSPSSVFFNDTLHLLETLKHAIRYGYRTFGDRELKDVPMFIQMKWVLNFQTPSEIMHYWLMINRFLHDIQSIVPEEDYQANREWLDNWFDVVHSFWGNLLKEVNKHLFFRTFRRIEDIPRFQHSVRWTLFFYMFQSDGDPHEIVALKEIIISNSVFKNGIRDFITAVEIKLDDVKPVAFTPMNVTTDDVLNDAEMIDNMNMILDVMNRDDMFQRWWSELLVDSCDRWRGTLLDVMDGDLDAYPRKEILASTMLWDVETIVAYIEPILFGKRELHRVLLSLRERVRRHIFQLILKESWF